MALNFRLFNCDRTFSLDKVEALIKRVAEKLSRETKIEKTYFPLPRMNELCRELEEEGSHFEYAVFVVHAHESRLWINTRGNEGYSKLYRTLQRVTGDRVLIVIGGDDSYKDQEERDMSVLSRWAWLKIRSQFTEDYVNGMKSFIFSWEENHHPIHEEALEFYLPKKFVPRPKPAIAKVSEKEDTKIIEQAKLKELKRQDPQPLKITKQFEKEFPPEYNDNRTLPSGPEPSIKGMTDVLQKDNRKMDSQTAQHQAKQASEISGTPDVHILPFHASQPSVDQVENVFKVVYKQLAIVSKPKSSADLQMNIQDHIMRYKPGYLVLVSELEYIEDMLHLENQVQRYKEIVRMSSNIGTKLIFIITEDNKYREGYMSSDAVHDVFTQLNQDIPSSQQPVKVMSWDKTPWSAHREALVQLLTPCEDVRTAPQQYGATKQDPTSKVPKIQPKIRKHFFKASISYGRVVKVLVSDPPDWQPDGVDLNQMLKRNKGKKKATIEFWDEGEGSGLQSKSTILSSDEAKLYKIAKGIATDKMHSILVYSYLVDEETNETVSNFLHHLDVPILLPWEPIKPASASLITDIMCNKPDYVMFFADADDLKDELKVKKSIQKRESEIKGIVDNFVGQGVIIMLFGDRYYKEGELASKEVTQDIRKLTQGIVEPGRLTVMTCRDKPYTTHQEWMEKILRSKGATQSASEGAVPSVPSHYYKAVIRDGKIWEVLEHIPPDWKPDEGIVRKKLQENRKEKKAYLEISGNERGEIVSIAVEKEWKGSVYYTKKFTSWLSGDDAKDKHSDQEHCA